MSGTVLKLWGKFYYQCENLKCHIDSVEISMKFERTPAGKFFATPTHPTPEAASPFDKPHTLDDGKGEDAT